MEYKNTNKWEDGGALEEYQLDQSEGGRSHEAGMDFERKLLQAVAQGDVEFLKKTINEKLPDFGDIGYISNNSIKQKEYLVVSTITLITRAAIYGGVQKELAHELGDVYLKKLSKSVDTGIIDDRLTYEAIIGFTELVRKTKENNSNLLYVEKCKDYVAKNLRKDITVGDIAPAIGLSRTYLSRLFHNEEGITLQNYIQKEKCYHAAQMLKYSNYSISQISQYLGFSSQSYFGSCFKKWYNMTPIAYRKTNHQTTYIIDN